VERLQITLLQMQLQIRRNVVSELSSIKLNSKGMQLLLDPNCDFSDLVTDVCYKYLKGKEFFGQRDIILELKGRELTPDETRVIIEAIELNSGLTIKLLREGNGLNDASIYKEINKFYYEKALENAKIIKGSVTENLDEELSVLILGDIKRNVTVKSLGSVICLGKIYGEVICGNDKDTSSFVIASEFHSDSINVCGYTDPTLFEEKQGLFKKKDKKGDLKCVCVFQNELILEPLENGILFS
ncbi:MAG: hypothetical protein K5675_02735, partial [Lachnospiraceae bacterium]|nr:hypothetical protein [Lachnospiraceae bacterium]